MSDFAALVGTRISDRPSMPQAGIEATADSNWAQIAASARCWAQSGDAFFPVSEVVNELPPGAYRCRSSNQGPYLERMPIEIDSLLTLPDSAVETLLAEFKQFWTLRENFSKRGFTFKRGLLMWGPPGSGKTSAIWQMTQELVRLHRGVVVFIEDPRLATACIGLLRRIEPERPMITIMEDLDALVQQHGDHGFLALLDGETQISNVVHVATTNYPEYLDRRFVDRPSRFDTIMRVGMPTADARRVYFKAKEPSLGEAELERWVQRTEDYSIAHLREVIIAIKCFDQTESSVFDRLDEMRQAKIESDGLGGQRGNVGFLSNAKQVRR
jgi:ATPase family associated with various cellular activities (AAA)